MDMSTEDLLGAPCVLEEGLASTMTMLEQPSSAKGIGMKI